MALKKGKLTQECYVPLPELGQTRINLLLFFRFFNLFVSDVHWSRPSTFNLPAKLRRDWYAVLYHSKKASSSPQIKASLLGGTLVTSLTLTEANTLPSVESDNHVSRYREGNLRTSSQCASRSMTRALHDYLKSAYAKAWDGKNRPVSMAAPVGSISRSISPIGIGKCKIADHRADSHREPRDSTTKCTSEAADQPRWRFVATTDV